MDFAVIAAGIAAVILIIVLVRLAAKNIFKIVAVSIVLILLAIYLFVVFGNVDEDIRFIEVMTEYTLEDLSDLYCSNNMSRTDSLKCHCIVQPLMQDMRARFSDEELQSLQNRRIAYANEIRKSFSNQRELINRKLKENNAVDLLKDFNNELRAKKK